MLEKTKRNQRKLLDELAKTGGNVKMACDNIGLRRDRYYDWLNRYPTFRMEIERLSIQCVKAAKYRLYQKALDGDVKALKAIKKKHDKKLSKLLGKFMV